MFYFILIKRFRTFEHLWKGWEMGQKLIIGKGAQRPLYLYKTISRVLLPRNAGRLSFTYAGNCLPALAAYPQRIE